jgi:hypothetical protein
MRRLPVIVVLLVSLLWQSVALARIGSSVNVLADIEHAALHWLGTSHHHHDDGRYHLDESAEAAQHVLTDQVSAPVEMLPRTGSAFPPLPSPAPHAPLAMRVPIPLLDGLLRPPRHPA